MSPTSYQTAPPRVASAAMVRLLAKLRQSRPVLPLVAPFVVAGEASHEALGVGLVDFGDEKGSVLAAQSRCSVPIVLNLHITRLALDI